MTSPVLSLPGGMRTVAAYVPAVPTGMSIAGLASPSVSNTSSLPRPARNARMTLCFIGAAIADAGGHVVVVWFEGSSERPWRAVSAREASSRRGRVSYICTGGLAQTRGSDMVVSRGSAARVLLF
jgi:hypothetical protein